jgi:transcriptional regulator with XRE-family HTH domain
MRHRNDKLRSREVGERIAQARREADGMTQRELADLISVTERSVAAYEAGDVIPYRYMNKLEEVLGRSSSWILYGEETPTTAALGERADEMNAKLDTILELLQQR